MTTFLALYRGRSVNTAQMVAISTDTELVSLVAERLLEQPSLSDDDEIDPVVNSLEQGRRSALKFITSEAH